MPPKEDGPEKDVILKDLTLQWQDHFHMRDQTWKTLTNSALFFLGVVGLEIKGVADLVMIPAYIILIVTTAFGWTVAAHHRIRQKQKFEFIRLYEQELDLLDMKQPIIERADSRRGILGHIFTARYIEAMHVAIGLVAAFLLVARTVA